MSPGGAGGSVAEGDEEIVEESEAEWRISDRTPSCTHLSHF